jgi:hypothetical protein
VARVSIAIQAHPARAEMADQLAACIGRADVVYDPDPAAEFPSAWRSYRRALEETPAGAAGRLIVQDDVLVCDRFAAGVELAATARPDRVLVFFVAGNPMNHRVTVMRACDRDETWAELDLTTWIPVVATLWPVRLIVPFLEWYDRQGFPPGFVADDEIAGRFLQGIGEPALACVPSLVEHPDTVPSLMSGNRRISDGRDPGRRAACYIGDCGFCDARLLDWTTGAGG